MKEKHPSDREQLSAGGGGLDSFFEDNDDGDLVRIASGPYDERLPVAYMTVGEIRARFRDRFDIDPRGQAVLDGIDAGDDTRVRPGQVLMFVHRVGEKGQGQSEVRNPINGRDPGLLPNSSPVRLPVSGSRISDILRRSALGIRLSSDHV